MISKKALEIVDKTLQDVCYNNEPFGGKLIILGGDFRQILPVVKHGFRNTIVEETIKYSLVRALGGLCIHFPVPSVTWWFLMFFGMLNSFFKVTRSKSGEVIYY